MNRAMGFGVLTGTMLGTTALTAAPSSAHVPPQTQTLQSVGDVSINSSHTQMSVHDWYCNDGYRVFGEFKVDRGSGLPPVTPAQEAVCSGFWGGATNYADTPGGAYMFRKCILGGNPVDYSCNDWWAL